MSGIPPGSCLCSTGSRLSSWWHLRWGPARSDWAQARLSTCKPPWWGQRTTGMRLLGVNHSGKHMQLKPPQQLEPIGRNRFLSGFSQNWEIDLLSGGILRWWSRPIKTSRSLWPVLFTFWFLNPSTKVYLEIENRWEKNSWSEIMIAVALESIFSVGMKTFYQLTRMLSRTLLNSSGSSFPSMAAGSSPSPP